MHLYDPGILMHFAFTPQAPGRPHSLMSKHSSCASPVYPPGHKQLKLPLVLTHSAFLAQGLVSHSLISNR